ncbi:MAG: hypothetical protein GY765_11270 [bacterium]|nr:hypothetical protein [bacterium]
MPSLEEIRETKKRLAVELADRDGFLDKQNFGYILGMTPQGVTTILNSPKFGEFTKGSKQRQGRVSIPLQSVLVYLDHRYPAS